MRSLQGGGRGPLNQLSHDKVMPSGGKHTVAGSKCRNDRQLAKRVHHDRRHHWEHANRAFPARTDQSRRILTLSVKTGVRDSRLEASELPQDACPRKLTRRSKTSAASVRFKVKDMRAYATNLTSTNPPVERCTGVGDVGSSDFFCAIVAVLHSLGRRRGSAMLTLERLRAKNHTARPKHIRPISEPTLTLHTGGYRGDYVHIDRRDTARDAGGEKKGKVIGTSARRS